MSPQRNTELPITSPLTGAPSYPSSLPNPSIRTRSGCGGSTSRPGEETLAVRTVAQSYRRKERRVDSTLEYRHGPSEKPIELVERTWSLQWYDDAEFATLASNAGLVVKRTIDHGQFGRSLILSLASVA